MSESAPNIKLNFIYRLLYEVLVIITPFITTPYISRTLGADGVGIHSYATSIMTYFVLIASLGTLSYGAREIARNREDKVAYSKLFWEIELMTIGTSFVCIIGWIVFVTLVKEYKMVFWALTPTLLAAMFDISWFYMGQERVIYSVIWNSICKIIGIIVLFGFVKEKSDLPLYTVINSGVLLIGNISMWIYLPKFLVKIEFKTLSIKRHIHETLVYFIPSVATTIYTVLDKTLIKAITGDVFQSGYYEQATKIINMSKTVVFASVNAVMGARISYLFARKEYNEIKLRICKSLDFILLLGYGVGFGIVGIADNFVPWFFGEEYNSVIYMLYIMAVLIIVIGISNCLGSQYYTPSGKRKESAKYIVIGSIVNLILNCIFIPQLGAKGAIVGSIVAELTITVLYIKHCDGFVNVLQIWIYSWKRIISGIVMLICIYNFGRLYKESIIITIIFQVIIGVAIYVTILLVLKDDMMNEIKDLIIQTVYKTIRRIKKNI